jgi:hypothetical protein
MSRVVAHISELWKSEIPTKRVHSDAAGVGLL